jgi:hypothetical protein
MLSNIKHNLTGMNYCNENNLTGKSNNTNNPFILKIQSLKNRILNNYLIPLFSKQWDILNQNVFFIDKYKDLLEKYYKTYKLDDLLVYIELLKILKLLIDKHNLLIDSEKQINNIKDPNDIVSMIYKTTMIRLVPEYEIYNSIIGRPKRELNQKYNEEIITDIKRLMTNENITFIKIKDFIEKKHLFKQ